jgi:hypothetical protein
MKKQVTERSNCCNAKVKVIGNVTLFYQCQKCHQACDVHFISRRVWAINPKTQITPDKREEENNKRIKKEINENI